MNVRQGVDQDGKVSTEKENIENFRKSRNLEIKKFQNFEIMKITGNANSQRLIEKNKFED